MYDPIIYGKILKVMVLLNYYNAIIHMIQEDCFRKLDQAWYHVGFLLTFELTFFCSNCISANLALSYRWRSYRKLKRTRALMPSLNSLAWKLKRSPLNLRRTWPSRLKKKLRIKPSSSWRIRPSSSNCTRRLSPTSLTTSFLYWYGERDGYEN